MQIKVYTINVKLPRWFRRALVLGVVPAVVLGICAIVYATAVTGQPDFVAGSPLSASSLNAHLGALQAQIDTTNGQVVPTGAVMAFDLAACPSGWTAYALAGGRTIVGVNAAGGNGLSQRNLEDTLGEEAHTMTVNELVPHLHNEQVANVNGYSGSDGEPGGDGQNIAYHWGAPVSTTGGGQPFNNIQPSLVLLYCKKS